MLGHTEAIVNGRIARRGIGPRGGTQGLSIDTCDGRQLLGTVLGKANKVYPGLEGGRVAALGHKGLVYEPFCRDHVGDGIQYRHVGARH